MPPDRPPAAALPLALVVCVLVVPGVAATPAVAVGEPRGHRDRRRVALTVTAPQDPAADDAALALDRPARRLIPQGLRNEGFDGLFGPRSRAAIRDWQQSRGTSPTGYLNGVEAELLRTAATSPVAVSESAPPPAARAGSTAEADSNPAPPAVATEADPQNAAATNTEPTSRPSASAGNAELPPDIGVDRHFVRREWLPADDDPTVVTQAMNEILALQEEHDVAVQDDFDFQYGQVAFAAGETRPAIMSLDEPLSGAGAAERRGRRGVRLAGGRCSCFADIILVLTVGGLYAAR